MREAPAEGYNYIFGLRSSNTSTADAADFAIKKTSAREVLFMVPVSRLTSLCFVAASSQGRRYPRLACSSWSNYRFGSSSCYINTIKKTSAREVLFMVPVSRLTSLCFVAASSQGRRYPRLACSSWSNYRFGSSSCYINTIKKTSAREVLFMVPVSRLELPTHALRMRCSTN